MAKALAASIGKEFDNFECYVCMEKFKDPRLLSCLHSYCTKCLTNLVERHQGKHVITCPGCRKETEVPNGNMESLQVNFFINSLMSVVAAHSDSPTTKPAINCGSCSAGEPPVAKCITCCHFLCDFCCQSHRRMNATKSHKLMTLEEVKSMDPACLTDPNICKVHEGQVVKMYCESCEELICRVCVTTELHRNHDILFMKYAQSKVRDAVSESLQKTMAKQRELRTALRGVAEMKSRVERAVDDTTQHITASFENIKEELDTRCRQLLQETAEIGQEKLKGLETQQHDLELALVTLESSAELATKSMNNEYQDLKIQRQMVAGLQDLCTATLQTKPCTDDVIWYTINNKTLLDSVNILGRVDRLIVCVAKCTLKLYNSVSLMVGEKKSLLVEIVDQHGKPKRIADDALTVQIEVPTGADPIPEVQLTSNADGFYDISFTPQIFGNYCISVTINGDHIHGSPCSLNATTTTCSQKCFLQIESGENGMIYNTLVGQTREFTIITRDVYRNQQNGNLDTVEVNVVEPNSKSPKLILVRNGGDGKYTFTFKPMLVGDYRLTAKVNDQDIRGSPFKWEVERWHMAGGGSGDENLHFSQDGRTVTCTGRQSRVAANSWKVKLVAPKCFAVGVTDTKVLGPFPDTVSWQRSDTGRKIIRSRDSKDSKISSFKEGDICGIFLKCRSRNQLIVRHLQSGESDIWDDVCSRRSNLYPLFYVEGIVTLDV